VDSKVAKEGDAGGADADNQIASPEGTPPVGKFGEDLRAGNRVDASPPDNAARAKN
jgi:hypothetical protein